ncbi:anthrax toxin lethal factor-related metalloendopeptidase [Enterococcus faecalis]|uniref:anthrax toxin lethal factor-related metalloendopeptidase n=1 Tax=Enterococcus faecalis TaxID=1351 RepID=UPI0035E596D7
MKYNIYSLIMIALFVGNQLPVIDLSEDSTDNESLVQTRQEIDHKTDKEAAKRWANEKYKNWEKNLTKNKREAIKSVLIEKQSSVQKEQLNHHLQYFGGDLKNFHVYPGSSQEKMKKKYEKDIDAMDRALNIKEGKTEEILYVYKDVSSADILNLEFGTPFSGINEKLLNGFSNINRESFKQLEEDLIYGMSSSYLITNIAEEVGGDSRIKLRIRVPKGTRSAYGGENKLIFDKNIGLEFKEFSIITQMGKEYVRVNADLVDKSNVDEKITVEKERINSDFNKRMNFVETKKLIDFDFKSLGCSIPLKEVSKELNTALNLMNQELAVSLYEHILIQKNGKIIFTDLPIWSMTSDVTMPIENDKDRVGGYYAVKTSGNIYIRMPFGLNKYNIDANKMHIHEVLLHESGHAFDYYYGLKVEGTNVPVSNSDRFTDIYNKEKENLTLYAASSVSEFFAEAFRIYHVSQDELKMLSPETYGFIDEIIHTVINK